MNKHKVIGLMSGTSLDGLDLCYCRFWKHKTAWDYEVLTTQSISYTLDMQTKLKEAILFPAVSLLEFHNAYGTWLGERTREFMETHNLEVDAIASHGHTVHHRPEIGLTFQLGSGQHVANASSVKTVCDFRSNDVALGGQGAPLVPIGDRLLFGEYDYCLNLGGISNISFEANGQRIAYDIGLANMVLNHITRKIGLDYDLNGNLARKGTINQAVLEQLNALEFYTLPHPKSIGYEWFTEKVAPIIDHTEDTVENLLHTCIHHICDQIALQIQLNPIKKNQRLLVTGGGAMNGFLIDTLKDKLADPTEIVVPNNTLVSFKEALIFAFMGVLRLENETNVLRSVTGAARNSCSGVIYLPQ